MITMLDSYSYSKGRLRQRLFFLLCLSLICFPSFVWAVEEGMLVVNVISVGHGDAVFIEFPDGTTMLVDGGTRSAGDIVVDYVNELGYSNIDYIVVTHDHDDHVGGLVMVLDSIEVGELWMSNYKVETPLLQDVMSRVEESEIPVTWVARGDEFGIGDVRVAILNPPAGSTLEKLGGSNNASIVMHLVYEEVNILLTADIDKNRDRELVSIYGDTLKSTVLKCAHHGSESSNSEEFLMAVNPLITVVSAGPSQYGYPSEITMTRIEKLVPEVYRTDQDGHIIVVMDGEEVRVETR